MRAIIDYLSRGLQSDLLAALTQYNAYEKIDLFRNLTSNGFYQRTIEGMIYEILTTKFPPSRGEYLYFLEQPYSPNDLDNLSDIMIVERTNNIANDEVYSIEIKCDYKYPSMKLDVEKLMSQMVNESSHGATITPSIAAGVMMYFVKDAATAMNWKKNLEAYIKNLLYAKFYSEITLVPIVHRPLIIPPAKRRKLN